MLTPGDTLGAKRLSQPEPRKTSDKVLSSVSNKPKKSGVRFDLKPQAPVEPVSQDLTYSDTEGDTVQQPEIGHSSGPLRASAEGRAQQGSENARGRSREEAMALRKKMMKYNPLEASGMAKKKDSAIISGTVSSHNGADEGLERPLPEEKQQPGLPPPALLSRLAKGEKVAVSKEEMHKLTTKNYHNLPEVKQKEAERLRKEQARALREKQKEFGRDLRSRSREADSPVKAS